MKIGGKFYLAAQAQRRRGAYARQMSRQTVQNHQAAIQHYGQALFSAKIVSGQEQTRQALEVAATRMSAEMQARVRAIQSNADNIEKIMNERSGVNVLV